MANFMDNYEPVANRIAAFWADHPNGRIITDIVQMDERLIIMRAEIYRNTDEQHPAAVDYAQERIGSTKITTDSWLEVCSTSAIGRALANLNYAKTIDGKIVRPSREEMMKTAKVDPIMNERNDVWIGQAEDLFKANDFQGLGLLRQTVIDNNGAAHIVQRIDRLGIDLKQRMENENGGAPGN
jgi:hypothetical protein